MKYELPKEVWVEVDSMELPNLFIATDKFGKTMYLQKQLFPTKPKVSLEELVLIMHNAWADLTIKTNDEAFHKIASSICTHLGIEIEPDKEEWEREFELLIPKGGEQISKVTFKQIFEAGQRSKEK